jgi:N-acetylmuramoyl-L-alanine amidase
MGGTAFAQNNGISKIKCVVIDPGHGGHDPGTISPSGKYKEKDIVLAVSLKLGSLIKSEFPDIKVLYTRSTDKFIPLAERSDFANRNNADLFISVHVNSVAATSVNGTETFVMGTHMSDSNFELCKAENSVIVMEDNYTAKYEGFNPNSPESYIIFSLLQNTHLEQSLKLAEMVQKSYKSGPVYGNRGVKQGGLIVLWRSTMPAILTEIGFISNAKDRAVLISKEGQTKIANRLFSAFCNYKKMYEEGTADISISTAKPATSSTAVASDEYYCIQILSVNKILKNNAPDLKGTKNFEYLKSGNLYKYTIGRYASRKDALDALPQVRKKFEGAFVIHVKNKQIIK